MRNYKTWLFVTLKIGPIALLGTFFLTSGTAYGSPWKLIDETSSGGNLYQWYINTSTFEKKGNFASALAELTRGGAIGSSKDTIRSKVLVDCKNWLYFFDKKWIRSEQGTIGDSMLSFLCSSDRITKSTSSNPTLNVNINRNSSKEIMEKVLTDQIIRNSVLENNRNDYMLRMMLSPNPYIRY